MWPPRSSRMLSGLMSLGYRQSGGIIRARQQDVPVDEAELVHSFQSQCDLGHVETSNVFGEDFILDQHGHEITTWQELHEHVEEGRILERGMQLDEPGTVGICKNVTFGTHVSELVLLEL
jgi:hypothetical protein